MRNFKSLAYGCLILSFFGAQAQGVVTAAMGIRTEIKAYSDADGKSSPETVQVKDITFPLKVFETSEAGLVRVKITDKYVWLDRKQIRIPPESITVSCTNVDRANASLVSAGIRGANSGCK